MRKDEKRTEPCLTIAFERIAAEKTARTGLLDLGNLGLKHLPASLSELDWLEELRLGGVVKDGDTAYRRSDEGSWEQTDEAYNPNRIIDIAPSLTSLSRLHILDCSGADLQDLSPLAGLDALQSLHCEDTEVTDLAPLAGLTALQSLHCEDTEVTDLSPLTGLTALQSLHCGGTPVADLAPLAGLTALQSLHCGGTPVADLALLAGLTALQSLHCEDTEVTDLSPLTGLTALQSLHCGGTPVADLAPLAGLTALQSLHCEDTEVTDLSPLTGLTALQSLHCGGTPVADLAPLAGLTALQSLHCGGTPVADLAPLTGLTALQSLHCQNTRVADLAPLTGLTALQSLHCQNTRVADLAPLTGLAALQSLHYQNTPVADLAPLAGLAALQSLNCQNTPVADLVPLAGLAALQSLNCSETRVADLAPLAGLTALQSLHCEDTEVTDLAPLAGLTALRSLHCELTRVADLAPLARLDALQFLVCDDTEVPDLAPLAGLTALQSLHCDLTRVADLSPLAGLTALQSLHCDLTRIADLSPLVGLTALRSLHCELTRVADLSPLAGLTALQSLHCGSTPVADLAPLAGLTALQSLHCEDTEVTDLAPLAGLAALQSLNLWNAPISGLPEAVIGLPKLKCLIINAQSSLRDIPAEVLSQEQFSDNCLPRLRAHLNDLGAGVEPLRDMKVIVLGNGRVGKTQICRRLRAEPFDAEADSTHGIGVTSVELAMPAGKEPAVLNLWDFGGQDIYHGTHALFMRTRALFLLVWTPDSEQGEHEHSGMVFRNHPLPYWLEYIRHLGGDKSPVVLVQNRCDGGLGESPSLPVDDVLLHPLLEDGRLFTRVPYSAKDDTGRARLMDALRQAAIQLRAAQGRPLIGRNRLAVWDRIRAWRDADARETDEIIRRHRLLPYREFETLCRKHGVHSPETFAEVLHHAGMVFYRPHLFDNRLVLDQSWALNAVYAIFTREGAIYDTLRRHGGRFTCSDLNLLLWYARGLSGDDQQSLLGMMENSGICFVHQRAGAEEETEYVAPDLLPKGRGELTDELAARWEPLPGEPLEATFAYPFLSPSITRAVLSELGALAGSTALYWRYGLCLYDAASRATAIIDEVPDAEGYGGQIRIAVKGAVGADSLLRALIKRIANLNEQSGWSNRLQEAEMPTRRDPTAPEIKPATPPAAAPAEPEVYVSYAWAQERKDPLVDDLCAALAEQGLHVGRDSTELQPGDRISRYMERLSAGRCVVLVLSEAYLRSEFCMTELYRLYTNARQRDVEFLHRIVPLVQNDARIDAIDDRIDHAVHWKNRYEKLDAKIREHGAEVVGADDLRRFKLIGEFYRHVGDMLVYANDVLVPRDRPTLSRDGFAMVLDLIDRALAGDGGSGHTLFRIRKNL